MVEETANNNNFELVNFCEFDKYASESYCAIHNVDEKLNLGNINEVNEKEIADFNFICGGSPCFVKGTKILTKTGYVNIEDILVGDYVLTHKNRYRRVLRKGHNENKDTFEVHVLGMPVITATENHPFMICQKNSDGSFTEPKEKMVKDLDKKKDYICSPVIQDNYNVFDLSYEDCYMLGFLYSKCKFYIGKNNGKSEYVGYAKFNKVNSEVNLNILNKYGYVDSTENIMCYKYYIRNQDFLSKVINDISFNQIVNPLSAYTSLSPVNFDLLKLSPKHLSYFLKGFFDDRYFVKKKSNNRYYISISDYETALFIQLVYQKTFNKKLNIYTRKNKTTKKDGTVSTTHSYLVILEEKISILTSNHNGKNIQNKDYVYYPINKIVPTNKKETVYNLEVNEDNTYSANNVYVHNCQDFSIAGQQQGAMWLCHNCGYKYNPLEVHYSKRKSCPHCNSENIEKTRSSLLVEWLRIIEHKHPKWGIYENVKNIFGIHFKDLFIMFINELFEYGYNVYFKMLNAKHFGVPQNRERIYLVFIQKDLDNGKFSFPESFDNGLRLNDFLQENVDKKYYLSEPKTKILLDNISNKENTLNTMQGGNLEPKVLLKTPAQTKRTNIPISGIDKSINNTRFIDYANCITASENRGVSNRKCEGTAVLSLEFKDVNPTDTPEKLKLSAIVPCIAASRGRYLENNDNITEQQLELNITGNCNTITTFTKDNLVIEDKKYIDNISDNKVGIKRAYNYFFDKHNYVPTFFNTYNAYEIKDFCPTLTANCGNTNTTSTVLIKETCYAIRKLTPEECFTLMGFDVDDCLNARNVGISDCQLYKQAGNSIVVDVLFYIFMQVYKVMPYLFDNMKVGSFFSGIGAFEKALEEFFQRKDEKL